MEPLFCRLSAVEEFLRSTDGKLWPIAMPADCRPDPALHAPYLARFRNVRLIPTDWLLLSDADELLFDTLHHLAKPKAHRLGHVVRCEDDLLELKNPGKEIEIREPAVLLGGCRNHYHWLVDYLPRVLAIQTSKHLRSFKVVVDADLTAAHLESLELAGIEESRLLRVSSGAFYRFAELWVPSLFARTAIIHPMAIAWLRKTYMPGEGKPAAHRKLFVSRRDAAKRHLLNEDEIRSYLEPLGFEPVLLGALSFRQQVDLFSRASIVVAPTGSGLANILFAPRETNVIELLNLDRQYTNFFGHNIARLRGQSYRSIPGAPVSASGMEPQDYDFSTDLAQLKEAIDGRSAA